MLFKEKMTEEDLAVGMMSFIRNARFGELSRRLLPPETPVEIIDR